MKNYLAYIRSMLSQKAFMNVFAEETKTDEKQEIKKDEEITPPAKERELPKPTGSVNYEDLIANARKDEKEKLYPEMKKLKDSKNELLIVIGERDATIKQLQSDLATAKESNGKLTKDLKDGTQTNKTVSELTLQISQLERDLEEATAGHETELNSIKLESFKEKTIASANGELIPELVVGNTEEDILASFETAKTRYAEITQRVVSGTKMPYTNPNAGSIQLTAKASEKSISEMTREEYAEYRKQIGFK